MVEAGAADDELAADLLVEANGPEEAEDESAVCAWEGAAGATGEGENRQVLPGTSSRTEVLGSAS